MAIPVNSEALPDFDAGLLRPFCRSVILEEGAILRERGQHYRDMYLMTGGAVEVELAAGSWAKPVTIRTGPVGEIGFLSGRAATATVTVKASATALVLDDPALTRIERAAPVLAARLLHYLAETAGERASFNLTVASLEGVAADQSAMDVYLCRDDAMLQNAKRLRYDVYCGELGRNSPFADHGQQIIDGLDDFGNTFVAIEEGETIGTIRSNLSIEGRIGHLEDIYGMRQSPHHPEGTAICTKFIVRKASRGSTASTR